MLTVLDLTTFAAYCTWQARSRDYQARLEKLRKSGRDVVKSNSGAMKPHPMVGMARQAAEMTARFAARFGLSPSDRSSVGLPLDPTAPIHDDPTKRPPPKPRDEFDEFLKKTRTNGPNA